MAFPSHDRTLFVDRWSVNEISRHCGGRTLVRHTERVTTRKEQAAQSRARLVDTALDLFVDQGYEATSVGQILDRAEMARGALYHYFPEGKKQLFLEVIDVVDHQLHEGFEKILTTIDSPIEQITAGFELLLRLAADRTFARIVLIEAAAVFPGAWTDGSEFLLLQDRLKAAMDAGEVRTMPLHAATSTLYGAARRAADFVARSRKPKRAAAEGAEVLRALLDGLRP
jgi:AcrR family transcriptional regulator